MYKVMILDDEKWIRKGIAMKISNMNLPIAEIVEVADVKSAEEAMEEHQLQVIVTDIRMEEDNGLDFIEEVSYNYPNTQFIILSGYSEFEYAKRAINIGVVAYLVKPVNTDELKSALITSFDKYEENKRSLQLHDMEELLKEEQESLQSELDVSKIFYAEDLQQSLAAAKNVKKNMGYGDGYFGCILLQIEESSYSQSGFNKHEIYLLKYGIKNILTEVSEICSINADVFMDIKYTYRLIILVRDTDEDILNSKISKFVAQAYNAITTSLNLNISISVSMLHKDLVKDLYYEAQQSMHTKFIDGTNRVFFYNKYLAPKHKIKMPTEKFEILKKYLKEANAEESKYIVHSIITNESGQENKDYILLAYMNIVNLALNSCDEAIYVLNSSENNYMNIENLERFENNEQIEKFIYEMIEKICDIQKNLAENLDCRRIMEQVKRYIDKNYMNKISVSELARLFNINYSYFSTIFKQEAGMTMTEYLRNVRIEKACSMLKDSRINTEFVAHAVGFTDVMHFYKIFKRTTGFTPTEYRNSLKK